MEVKTKRQHGSCRSEDGDRGVPPGRQPPSRSRQRPTSTVALYISHTVSASPLLPGAAPRARVFSFLLVFHSVDSAFYSRLARISPILVALLAFPSLFKREQRGSMHWYPKR